jgi:exonuclease III
MRGTAILSRNEIPFTIVHKLPSGRDMSDEYSKIRLINVYAPSGSALRTEREKFFNTELPFSFLTASPHSILGEDFNCVLSPADTNGAALPGRKPCRALSEIVQSLALFDTWKQDPLQQTFTHHPKNRATRLDRIYVSSELVKRKSGVEIMPAAFTGHHGVGLRLTIQDQVVRRKLRRWRVDPTVKHDDARKGKYAINGYSGGVIRATIQR